MVLRNRTFHRLQIILSLILLVALLLFVNLRIDLDPNTVTVRAQSSDSFNTPEIYVRTGNGYEDTVYSSGQILPVSANALRSVQIDFHRNPRFTGDDFRLREFVIDDEIESSSWTALLNPFTESPDNLHSISITPLDQDMEFKLFVDDVLWPLEDTDGVLSALNPGLQSNQVGRIVIAQKRKAKTDEEIIQPVIGFESFYTINNASDQLLIKSISFEKHFSRLGIIIPIKTWKASGIVGDFAIDETELLAVVENGYTAITANEFGPIRLTLEGNITKTVEEINAKILQFMILINLLVVIAVVVFYVLLGKLISFIQIQRPKHWNEFTKLFGGLTKGSDGIPHTREIPSGTITKVIVVLLRICFFACLILSFFIAHENRDVLIILFITGCLSMLVESRLSKDHLDIGNDIPRKRRKRLEVLIVVVLVILNGVALFYKLGNEEFKEDEFQVISSAAGYMHTGEFSSWNWIEEEIGNPYARAWPHTFLIAQAFTILGISEFSGRIVSVLGGLVFIICLYFFAGFFTNRRIALLTLFSVSLFPAYLGLFRYARMYALLLPMFLILTYCIYRALTGDWHIKTGIKRFDDFVGKFLNFDYRFLLLSIPILYLTYLIHVNSLIIVLAAYLFVCVLALKDKEKKYIVLAILGLAVGTLLISVMVIMENTESIRYSYESLPKFSMFFSFFERRNFVYLDYLVSYPFGKIGGLFLVGLLCYILLRSDNPKFVNKYLYLLIIGAFAAVFFIYIADRYASFFYISHVTPITLLLILSGFYYFGKMSLKKPFVLTLMLCTLIVQIFWGHLESLYGGVTRFGDFRSAYQVIIDHYDEENEVIFGQYLRGYYLQEMDGFTSISLKNNRQYTFEQFLDDLEDYDSGWLTWESRKAYHVDPQIISYANDNFYKIHGRNVDDFGVEVYYFTPGIFGE